MNISNKNSTKRRGMKLLLIIAVLSVAVIGTAYWLGWYRVDDINDTNTVDYTTRTEEDKRQADEKKEEIIRNEKNQPQPSTEIGVIINRFLQIPASTVQLRSTLSGVQESKCSATFTSGEQKFEKTFPSQYTGTYWACNTDLSASDFPADGTWTVNLQVITPDGNTSKPASAEARIVR